MADTEQEGIETRERQGQGGDESSADLTVTSEDTPELAAEENQAGRSDGGGEEVSSKDTGADTVAALRQELDETKAREAEYLDGWQRARAELSNARKRFQRDREQAYDNARGDVLAQVLPVLDDLERALGTMPEDLSGAPWTEGIVLIQRNLEKLLERSGVAVIEAAGKEFDPLLHEALTHEPSETVPAGQVIAELLKGYRMGDRILRPSVVRVSAGPPSVSEPEEKA